MNPIKVAKKVKNHVRRRRGRYGFLAAVILMMYVYGGILTDRDNVVKEFLANNDLLDDWHTYLADVTEY